MRLSLLALAIFLLAVSGYQCVDAKKTRGCGRPGQHCCNKGRRLPFCFRPYKCRKGRCVDATPPPPDPQPPFGGQPTDSLTGEPCALEGQQCCSGAADEPQCVRGLTCENSSRTCAPCGGLGQLECRSQGFGLVLPILLPGCDEGLTPVEGGSGDFFCRKVEPQCPGARGERCCDFISDASSCGDRLACTADLPGPDFGVPTAEGICVPCGGFQQFACFELSIAGVSGPICGGGLAANEEEPPKCVRGGTGPPCTGLLCPRDSE